MARISEKNWHFGVAAAAFIVLAGCPLYDDECDSWDDCASGFRCDRFSRRCEPVSYVPGCLRPDQCDVGETCTSEGICRPGSCEYHGCVSGYRCGVVDSAHACVPITADAATSDPGPLDSGAGGSGNGDSGPVPVDAASGAGGGTLPDASIEAGADASVDASN